MYIREWKPAPFPPPPPMKHSIATLLVRVEYIRYTIHIASHSQHSRAHTFVLLEDRVACSKCWLVCVYGYANISLALRRAFILQTFLKQYSAYKSKF